MKPKLKIAICAGTALTGAVLAAFSPMLAAPVIALAACMAVNWGALYLLPVLICFAAGSLLIGGFKPGAIATAAMLVIAASWLAVGEKRRFPHRYLLLGLAVIGCVGFYLSLTLDSIIASEAPYAGLVKLWDEYFLKPFSDYAPSAAAGYADVVETLQEFSDAIPKLLMPFSILLAEAFGLVAVIMYRLWCRLLREPVREMAPLREWRLPSTVLIGCLIMGVGIALVYIFKVSEATAIALSLAAVIVSLLSVQGLAYLLFILKASKAPKVLSVLLWVICFMSFPYIMVFLSLIGIREQLQNRRLAVKRYLAEAERMSRAEKESDDLAKYGYVRKDDKDDKDEQG